MVLGDEELAFWCATPEETRGAATALVGENCRVEIVGYYAIFENILVKISASSV